MICTWGAQITWMLRQKKNQVKHSGVFSCCQTEFNVPRCFHLQLRYKSRCVKCSDQRPLPYCLSSTNLTRTLLWAKKKKKIYHAARNHPCTGVCVCGWFLKKPKMFANACNTVWNSDELLMICAISRYAKEAKVTRFYCILDGKAQCYCRFL